MPRKSQGRKKVEMAKIENKGNLEVTFSKRREGMFKKANELDILCGAETGIVVFAPNNNKVYSFGHPSVDQIVDRYLARYLPNDDESSDDGVNPGLIEALRKANASIINELNEKEQALQREKMRGEALRAVRRDNGEHNWWEAPINKLNYVQLQQVKEAMEGAYEKVDREALRLKTANENVAFPYSNFASALAPGPGHNFDSSGASGSGSTSYFDSNRASGSGSAS